MQSKAEAQEATRMQELIIMLSKLTLNNTQQNRMLKAIVVQCFKVLTKSTWVEVHKEARASYAQSQQEAKKEGTSADVFKEKYGLPHVWGMNAWIKQLLTELETEHTKMETDGKDPSIIEQSKTHIQLIKDSLKAWPEQGGWKLIHKDIPHCSVSKMFNSAEKRVEVSCPMEDVVANNPSQFLLKTETGNFLRPVHVWLELKDRMIKQGAKEMQGIAPAGDLERKIQSYLDDHTQEDK